MWSLRQLLKPESDQFRYFRILADAAGRRRDGSGRLRLAVAKIDQRRDRIRDGARRTLLLDRAHEAHKRAIHGREFRRLALELVADAVGHFRPDTGRARDCGLVAHRDRGGELVVLERAEHRERHLGANALHGLQQAKPFALDVSRKTIEADLILPHIGLNRQRREFTRRRKLVQGAGRAMHLVADTTDIKDHEVLAIAVDDAFELADHLAAILKTTLWRWCACVTAIA